MSTSGYLRVQPQSNIAHNSYKRQLQHSGLIFKGPWTGTTRLQQPLTQRSRHQTFTCAIRSNVSETQKLPIVILPGFGNNATDYIAPFGDPDRALTTHLERRGYNCRVLDIRRRDWFKVGRMMLSKAYWEGKATTKEGYHWYIDRAIELIDSTREEFQSDKVILVGHSAGGWLGRAIIAHPRWSNASPLNAAIQKDSVTREEEEMKRALWLGGGSTAWLEKVGLVWRAGKFDTIIDAPIRGDVTIAETEDMGQGMVSDQRTWEDEGPHEAVAALVTLGTPHVPPCPTTGKKDMTGGALTWVHSSWPGAHFASRGLAYVSVASRAVRGDRKAPRGSLGRYACNAYREVVGEGHGVEGDAVVPLKASLLVSRCVWFCLPVDIVDDIINTFLALFRPSFQRA